MPSFVSRPIQVIPPGLLGFLQLKSPAGRNPEELNGDVQPTLEMLEFYLNANREFLPTAQVSLGSGASGFTGFTTNALICPQDQWWYVHDYTVVSAQVGAGDTILDLRAAYRKVAGAAVQALCLSENGNTADAVNERCISRSYPGFWVAPGEELCIYVSLTTLAAARVVFGDALVTRLPV